MELRTTEEQVHKTRERTLKRLAQELARELVPDKRSQARAGRMGANQQAFAFALFLITD